MTSSKLSILLKEYRTTQVRDGSRTGFFFCFWLTKLLNRVDRLSPLGHAIVSSIHRMTPTWKFVIENKRGVFAVEALDDSLTICADYFEHELRPWLWLPKTRDIFVDIGANRGIYTILSLREAGYTYAHAFEPNPEVAATLKTNMDLNTLTARTTVHTAALGSAVGTVSFAVDPIHKGGGHISTEETKDKLQQVSVQTLDTVLKQDEQARVSFVKIDTEGYEQEVLGGMQETLTAMLPRSCLMIETTEVATVTALVQAFGFVPHSHSNNDHLFIKQ